MPKDKADDMDWDNESTGGELYKFEKIGDSLKGLIINKKTGKTSMGQADFYTILSSKGEHTFIPTKALKEDLDKFLRMYGGLNKVIVEVTLSDLKKGNYASPFKVFRVRAGVATEQRLSSLGITVFDDSSTTTEDKDDDAPIY